MIGYMEANAMRFSFALAVAVVAATTSSAATSAGNPAESQTQQSAGESALTAENYSSVEAVSGKTLQLNSHASVTKDCSSAPLPTIRLVERPRAGTFTVRRGTLTGAQVGNCRNLNIPAEGVFFTSRPGYVGDDHVVYELITFEGKAEKYDIVITVRGD
jgi:hypothetical protein